jgi:hypothetical protein
MPYFGNTVFELIIIFMFIFYFLNPKFSSFCKFFCPFLEYFSKFCVTATYGDFRRFLYEATVKSISLAWRQNRNSIKGLLLQF